MSGTQSLASILRAATVIIPLSLSLSALAFPTHLTTSTTTALLVPRGAEGEPFTCPDPSGTSAAKQKLLQSGAGSVDIAIAMLENGCAFTATGAAGNGKEGDNAELGVYRNNWYMLRTYCGRFVGAGEGDWYELGQQVHNDVTVATQCQRQLWDTLGAERYFELQRGGLGNLAAGQAYGEYVWKYNDFVNSDGGVHLSDGMATYWNVPSM